MLQFILILGAVIFIVVPVKGRSLLYRIRASALLNWFKIKLLYFQNQFIIKTVLIVIGVALVIAFHRIIIETIITVVFIVLAISFFIAMFE